jgi:D-alanyl-D-alanine carboxypeptidase
MVTSQQCFAKYGDPSANEGKFMVVWDVPSELEHGAIPRKIYCNKDIVPALTQAFKNINDRGLANQVKTWDGCFNIRKKRGATSMSLHSWGLAIDINAAWNGFGKRPTMSPELVKCFTDAGLDWGGVWKKPDGMHFQIAKLP